ncbi:hypothetical protein A4H97_22250 [Niastella yeongjuensis]|uniref:Biopterin-dependent aromatic amino acid hydroxylase family profile domain-containing protein n=1 Tax=Niastella yeongjuensis TaxID=354355 RepID=A0A1V9F7G7_9BACT|nr:hypothetical protein [Niastella yeongjuensis]OQP54222.1 hypothetical protein A4H97_22250 [Niastella yeongjuensis]SEP31723.1 Phenylalanine 4-hydroxylase [Niastella yeongjuensis]
MKTYLIEQEYDAYSSEDHLVWEEMNRRQAALNRNKISKEYWYGLDLLQIQNSRLPNIAALSNKLSGFTGWSLVPVKGLIPAEDFFNLIIEKKYPVTTSIRKASELNFSEQPDIFHDVLGHLPLLINKKFSDFLIAYSKIAIRYVGNEHAVELLARLYWYTYEMGLIVEDNEYKVYGGAIITSANEIENIRNARVPKHSFNIDHLFRTPYNPYKLQNEYFVINDFSSLFDSLVNLESRLERHLSYGHITL